MASRLSFSIDPTKSISRLLVPGSKFYLLRPNGFGKSTLLQNLEKFLLGGDQREAVLFDSWILENRKTVVNNFPSLPTLKLDFQDTNLRDNEVDEPESFLREKIEMAQEISKSKKKAALLVDNFDSPYLRQDYEGSKFLGELLKLSCDFHDRSELLSYIYVTGVYRVGEENTFESLSRMHDLSLDLLHHDIVGISDCNLRDQFMLQDSWISHHERFTTKENLEDGLLTKEQVAPKQRRAFRWNDTIGDREEIAVNKPRDATDLNTSLENESSRHEMIQSITNKGGYWWGGYDNEGRQNLVHPFAPHKSSNAQSAEEPNFGIPSINQTHNLISAMITDIPFESLLRSKVQWPDEVRSQIHDDATTHLPSLLLQQGILTLDSRSAIVREFHTEVFMRLRFPNELRRRELFSIVFSQWMGIASDHSDKIYAILNSICDQFHSIDETHLIAYVNSLDQLLYECADAKPDEMFVSSMTNADSRLYTFLLLLLCVPKMEVMRTHPKYLDGGPTDTFLFEGTGHASTNPAESQTPKDPLKMPIVLSPSPLAKHAIMISGMKVGGSIDIRLVSLHKEVPR